MLSCGRSRALSSPAIEVSTPSSGARLMRQHRGKKVIFLSGIGVAQFTFVASWWFCLQGSSMGGLHGVLASRSNSASATACRWPVVYIAPADVCVPCRQLLNASRHQWCFIDDIEVCSPPNIRDLGQGAQKIRSSGVPGSDVELDHESYKEKHVSN